MLRRTGELVTNGPVISLALTMLAPAESAPGNWTGGITWSTRTWESLSQGSVAGDREIEDLM